MRNSKPRSIQHARKRCSVTYPAPKKYPCRIEVDFWNKAPSKSENKKKTYQKLFYRYADVVTDSEGWVDAKLWLPAPFDLMKMKTTRNECIGWWTGKDWEGLRLRQNDTVLYWKLYDDGERIWQ